MVIPSMAATKKRRLGSARPSLGAAAWVDAAVGALVRGGLGAVAIEPLAASLGVTKGSFYWHFEDRAGLVRALLERWESEGTLGVITRLDAVADPAARLRKLFAVSLDDVTHLRAEASLSAAATAGDAVVAPVVQRVMRRRLAYLTSLYEALGVEPDEAARMGLVAYGAYLGGVQLAAHGLLGAPLAKQIETMQRMLVPKMPRVGRRRS